MRCLRRLLGLGLLVLTAPVSSAPPLEALTEEFPPYNYQQDGQPQGLGYQLAQGLARRIKRDLNVQFLPWARAYRTSLERPNTLLFSMIRTPERESQFHWLGPMDTPKSALYRLRERGDIRLSTLNDVHTYRVGVVRSASFHRWFLDAGFLPEHLDLARDYSQNLQKLLVGRVDLIPGQHSIVHYHLRQLKLPDTVVQPALDLDTQQAIYLALSRKSDPALMRALDQAWTELVASGELAALQARYLKP